MDSFSYVSLLKVLERILQNSSIFEQVFFFYFSLEEFNKIETCLDKLIEFWYSCRFSLAMLERMI